MLFNSIDFAIFLPIVFILYWFVTSFNLKLQNLLILFSSYIFYGWWDYRFLGLLIFSTLIDFFIGIILSNENNLKKRRILLAISIIINLGLLGFFKYYNFFIENFVSAFSLFGQRLNINSLYIILPVGISFYTFQTLSYTIDIYKRKLNATKDFIAFSSFVSFFPQLVAGPIERASNLLPQFFKKRTFCFHKAESGLNQILWGLFKKIVIADTCAIYVDDIFQNYSNYSGATLILGAILFSIQIYSDFSGYSDIAIGVSKLFGFNLMTNFKTPYFSRNIPEFWRRWHISLSTWFRDYVYIPLGGSKTTKIKIIRNILIIFLISGFWHGANWTYIFWGLINALLFIPFLLFNKKNITEKPRTRLIPSITELSQILFTFSCTTVAWIFFRSKSLFEAFGYIKHIFIRSNFFTIQSAKTYERSIIPLMIYVIIFIVIDWIYRNDEIVFYKKNITNKEKAFTYILYAITIISIMLSIKNEATGFIYFQF